LAVFGELSFKITEQLKATVGGRISKTSFVYNSFANGPYNNGLSIVGGTTKEKPITPKFSLSYQVDEDNLVYATAAKGFRGGGANYQPPAACNAELASLGYTSAPISFAFDSVWSYELGAKNRLFGGRLQLDSSIYQIDWDNIQQNASLSSCGFAFVRNAGKARSRGFDVAAQAKLWDDLSVGLSLGYNKAIYTTSIFGGLNAAGVRPALVIEGQTLGTTPLTFAGFAEYQHDLFDDKSGYASMNFQYGEKSGITAATDPRSPSFDAFNRRDPATFNLNVRAGVRFQGVDAALFANNLLDTHPLLSRGRAGGTRQQIYTYTTTQPRVMGLQLSYRY
jgi:outer membrane receptor protein involved in Fe transport